MASGRVFDHLVSMESSGIDTVQRYKAKLKAIDDIDPYTLEMDDLATDVEVFPKVTPFHIITYLVLTHSFYTDKQMQAYKSLNAYKYFEAGFVQICGAKKINDMVVIVGKVKHSQRMNLPPLKVWISFETDGGINSGHCTCMAGLSEVCSHVAACLYGLEYIHNSQTATSCTDISAKWMEPLVRNVPIVSLNELRLGKHRTGTTGGHHSNSGASIPPIEGDQLIEMMKAVEEIGSTSAVMRVVEPFASEIASKRKPMTLPTLYDIYNPSYVNLSLAELCVISQGVNQVIDEETCSDINKITIKQAKSREWFNQRAGRIKASRFKSVCRTNIMKPSISLIKTICYPLKFSFKTKATEWGLEHEEHASECYRSDKLETHVNFKMEPCGLYIDKNFPAFGASPDSIVECDCCGKGCVEVKCPYLLKNMEIGEYLSLENSCLSSDGEKIYSKHDHPYYYQVQ